MQVSCPIFQSSHLGAPRRPCHSFEEAVHKICLFQTLFHVCHSHWRTLCICSTVRLFFRHRRWFLARFSYTEKWWNSCDMSRCFTILVNICYQTIQCLACSLVVFRVSKMETIHHQLMLKCLYNAFYLLDTFSCLAILYEWKTVFSKAWTDCSTVLIGWKKKKRLSETIS